MRIIGSILRIAGGTFLGVVSLFFLLLWVVPSQELTTQDQVAVEITKIINATKGATDPEVKAARAILLTLSITLGMKRTRQFFEKSVLPYAEKELGIKKEIPRVVSPGKIV